MYDIRIFQKSGDLILIVHDNKVLYVIYYAIAIIVSNSQQFLALILLKELFIIVHTIS